MTEFISWYILITILGWLTYPLAWRFFPALADRGYTLSRAFGLLIWGYIFWLFASLGIAHNDIGGLLLGLSVLGGLSVWAVMTGDRVTVHRPSSMVKWVKENSRLIFITELLFLIAFGFMAIVRAANPEIAGTEKPMELMFINGIMNSPAFPPRDLWLSGYAISYYYFGYVMTSMLAMFTGAPATVAFNLMIALIFALSAIGAYGILYNILATVDRGSKTEEDDHHPPSSVLGLSFLAPLFLLILSNVEGFLEVLHRRGIFWSGTQNFWTWLDIPELRDAPAQPLQWIPDRFWWWWRASRVVQDYDLNGTFRETIDEFPAFSYILGDLHPHVLAMPFLLLAVAVALNLFLGGWRGSINLYLGQLRISKTGFFVSALVLGGLAFLNTWDVLIAAALIVFSYALAQVAESGWGWERIVDVLLLGIPLAVTAFVMYLPFHIGFDSQAGGITPNFMYPTRGAHLWVMWGTLFVPLFAFLIHLWRRKTPAHWRAGTLVTLGIILILFIVMFALGFLAFRLKPEIVMPILQAQGRDAAAFIADSMVRRLSHIGSLLTLMALLIPTLAFLFTGRKSSTASNSFIVSTSLNASLHPSSFILLLIALGALLILGPDFLYLRDQFGYRINTVFKFYYQAWILLSLASAYGAAVLLRAAKSSKGERRTKSEVEASRGSANIVFSIVFVLILIVGLTYPILGFSNKTSNFKPVFGYTLDDFDRVKRENPDEAAAILWLRSAPDGVVAEAVGGAYSSYARISVYTGCPPSLAGRITKVNGVTRRCKAHAGRISRRSTPPLTGSPRARSSRVMAYVTFTSEILNASPIA
jgi:YYY domain-containing protein